MSYYRDTALRLAGDDPGRLFAWLQGFETTAVSVGLPSTTELARDFDLVEITQLSSCWEEDGPGTLTAAVTDMVGGLLMGGSRLLVVVRRSGPTLTIAFGSNKATAGATRTVLSATFRGAQLRSLAGPDLARRRAEILNAVHDAGARVALVGTPRTMRSPRHLPLIERLMSADCIHWTLRAR